MNYFDYSEVTWPIRADIADAHTIFWQALARPGSWWTGTQRIAIAAESRQAVDCDFCQARKQALSPYAFAGEHQSVSSLSSTTIDAVHRIITDQGRITQKYVDDNEADGLTKAAYVELVGIVVAVFSIDEFHRAMGIPIETLPTPEAGEISRYTPAHLSEDMGFVPTVSLTGSVGQEADLWPTGVTANVVRALTLVPDALRDWRALAAAQYLSFAGMQNFVQDDARSINRMQMELVAGRVSAINECFY